MRNFLDQADVVHLTCLENVTTDSGRGRAVGNLRFAFIFPLLPPLCPPAPGPHPDRAWVRMALNEQTMQGFLKRMAEEPEVARAHYDDHAFLLDEENTNTLAMLFQGASPAVLSRAQSLLILPRLRAPARIPSAALNLHHPQ